MCAEVVPTNRRPKHFEVDARTILALGRESIKDHVTAVLELVKNSYDASATLVEIEIMQGEGGYVRVADNGIGMTEEDLDKRWLRIGYSAKREQKTTIGLKRRKTGEKGVGRISADRLGSYLKLRTKARGGRSLLLEIDWDRFDVQGRTLQSVDLFLSEEDSIKIPSHAGQEANSGTEIIIRGLRQDWTAQEVTELYDEVSTLTPPFAEPLDFSVYLKTDVPEAKSGLVVSSFLDVAELSLTVNFDGRTLSYMISGREGERHKDSIAWEQLVSRGGKKKVASEPPSCGPVVVNLLFYPRKSSLVRDTPFSLRDLRQFLDRNAGVRIYRDNIRVRPYGEIGKADGDWLSLAERKSRDPAGAGRKSFRIGANQLVGAVLISRDSNEELSDSTSREGLVHNEAFFDLRDLVLGSVTLLEANYHELFLEDRPEIEKESPRRALTGLQRDIRTLGRELRALSQGSIAGSVRGIDKTADHADEVVSKISEVSKSVEELVSQVTVYRGLATVGIAAAVFGHETQISIAEVGGAVATAQRALEMQPPRLDYAVDELQKARKYASQVSSWGAFALTQVRRDKRTRRRVDIQKLVTRILKDLENAFAGVNIKVEPRLRPVTAKTFPMDVEAVLVNLLTNAYSACQQARRKRAVEVCLAPVEWKGREGFLIEVGDSGPGVALQLRERIWDPLFSTKVDGREAPVGTGLGLSIVQSVVDDLQGWREVESSPLGGALFKIWLPVR